MGTRGRKSGAELAIVPAATVAPSPSNHGLPAAPRHLSAASAAWWRTVIREYALEGHHLRLLQAAAEAWDRSQEAREALAQHGIVFVDDKGSPRARPEVAIERDSRLAFARLIRELDLDVEGPRETRSRPPAIGSNRRGA